MGAATRDAGVLDDPWFHDLYAGEAARLVRLAHLLGADDPEDVVQESFCRLYARRDRLGGVRVPAYLTRMVVNEVRTRGRRSQLAVRKRRLLVTTLPEPTADPGLGDRRWVVEAVGRLPQRQREAIVLRYWLDLPLAEVAALMGVRPGTVKAQVSRGLAVLARAMEEDR